MNNFTRMSMKKGNLLALSNKSMLLCIDKLTLHITTGSFDKAKGEIRELKEHIAEAERLIAECQRLEP
jgi:hypothetical protein